MTTEKEKRTVLVKDASTAAGRAAALALAKQGFTVAVADANVERAMQVVRMIQESGGAAFFARTLSGYEAVVEGA